MAFAGQADSTGVDAAPAAADSTEKPKSELQDTVRYEAGFIDYDNEERVLTLIGGARVRYQNVTLEADTIVYTLANDQFQARGRPQLVEGNDTTVGGFMAYNIKTRRGRVSYALTRFDDTYVTGGNIVKTRDNRLYIEQGDYTTCQNPQHPHYYFYGRHILAIPDDKVVGRPVVMNIGDAPVAVLPYFVMPLRRGRRSGWLTPSWGGSVARGGYIDNLGYYYAPNDYFDATLSAKAQEFNSFVLNARGRYNLRYTLDGEVSGRYVLDNRLETANQEWALDYRHNQMLSPDGRTRLSGYGSLVSNSSFNQLYSDRTYELEKQQLDANMSLSHRFDAINASTNLVWRRNHNLSTDRIIEDMPMFDFRLQNRAFIPYRAGGTKSEPSWYNNIYYAYDTRANLRRDAYGGDSVKGFIRPGMEHNANITATQKILKYLDASPYVNMRAWMFYGAIDTLSKDTLDTEFNMTGSWNTGVNLSTRLYGLFPVNRFGVTAVRHTLTPTVGYSFTPKHELDRSFYNVGTGHPTPRAKAEQSVTFGLSNTFQGKKLTGKGADRAPPGSNGDKSGNGVDGAVSGINNGYGVSGSGVEDEYAGGADSAGQARNDTVAVDTAGNPANTRKTGARSQKREEKFDILTLSMNTAFNPEAELRRWSNLNLSAGTGIGILRVSFSSKFWFYNEADSPIFPAMSNYSVDLTSGRLGVSGRFWDGDLLEFDTTKPEVPATGAGRGGGGSGRSWDIGFSPSLSYRASRGTPADRFTPTKSFNVSSSAGVNLTKPLSVRWSGNYDFSSDRFSHNSFDFYYDLDCFEMRFTWRPERINPGFSFVVNIKKIPDIKWEQKDSRSTRVL
jgi:lipopolysaccharide assembly outer membrane protein LptD (OstA)